MIKDEFNKTLKLLIEEKQRLIQLIKKGNNENQFNDQIFENIFKIDNKIKEYYSDIEKEKNKNSILTKDENLEISGKSNNIDNIKNKNNENECNESKSKTKSLKNPKIKKYFVKISLDDCIIKKIKEYKGKTDIPYFNKKNNIKTIFSFKNSSINYYYYQCNKRPKCHGYAKLDKNNKEFIITNLCTNYNIHNKLNYEEFSDLIKKNEINLIDFNIRKNQKNLIKYIISNNSNKENLDIKTEYYKYTKTNLILNNVDISKIKTSVLGKYNNLTFLESIKKISIPNVNIDIKSKDIKYIIKKNSKNIEREDTIIIFGNRERLKLIIENFSEYYIDSTYKIIPKKFNPYKLLTIASIDINNKKTILIAFTLFCGI